MTYILRSKRTRNGIRLMLREKYKIDIRYKTRTEVTDRTVATAEAFGLGVDDEREFPIVDNVDIDVNADSVVYITGDSGSGKSSILRELERLHGDRCVNINRLQIDESKPLIDTVGRTLEEGLELLSRVGLNDAFLFIRRYSELSDGQKYRYRLAKLIESGKEIWVADEFCSTLDRDTAKIVSFNVQKAARQLNRGLFVATCNTDLADDVNPSVRIDKRYGKEMTITYAPNDAVRECSLIREMKVEECTKEDYEKLCQFHYRGSFLPWARKIFRLVRGSELCGVVTYNYPPMFTFGRRKAMGRVVKMPELNQILSIISRVIIHPKYRTIGLGAKIVRDTLPLAPTSYVEAIAVMAKYNPFFERAGMTKVEVRDVDDNVKKAVAELSAFGFDAKYIGSVAYNTRKLQALTSEQIDRVKEVFVRHNHPRFSKHVPYVTSEGKILVDQKSKKWRLFNKDELRAGLQHFSTEKLANLIHVLALMSETSVYLIWHKPAEATAQ